MSEEMTSLESNGTFSRICVAIPVHSKEYALQTAHASVHEGANFIEYRLDYISTITTWTVEDLVSLIQPFDQPVILTMRSKGEGGQLELSEVDRIAIIERCIKAKPAFVDIEINNSKPILDSFYKLAQENHVRIIYSIHNFKETPPFEEIDKSIQLWLHKCPGFKKGVPSDNILKVIFTAQTIEDNWIPMELIQKYQTNHVQMITFCMGEKGILSRVMSTKMGAYYSFASLVHKTAPGQVSISEFHQLLNENLEIWGKFYFKPADLQALKIKFNIK